MDSISRLTWRIPAGVGAAGGTRPGSMAAEGCAEPAWGGIGTRSFDRRTEVTLRLRAAGGRRQVTARRTYSLSKISTARRRRPASQPPSAVDHVRGSIHQLLHHHAESPALRRMAKRGLRPSRRAFCPGQQRMLNASVAQANTRSLVANFADGSRSMPKSVLNSPWNCLGRPLRPHPLTPLGRRGHGGLANSNLAGRTHAARARAGRLHLERNRSSSVLNGVGPTMGPTGHCPR